jgi:hypothetical protein
LVLTNNIKIVSHGALDLVKVKAKPAPDAIAIYSNVVSQIMMRQKVRNVRPPSRALTRERSGSLVK